MIDQFATSDIKISYILGAGASANAFPTVKKTNLSNGFSDVMKEFADWLENNPNISSDHGIYTK